MKNGNVFSSSCTGFVVMKFEPYSRSLILSPGCYYTCDIPVSPSTPIYFSVFTPICEHRFEYIFRMTPNRRQWLFTEGSENTALITGGSVLSLSCNSYTLHCNLETWAEGFSLQKCNITKMHFLSLLFIICLCLHWPLPLTTDHHEQFLRIGFDWIIFLILCQLWSFSNKSQPINDNFVKKPRENFPSWTH